MGEDILLSKDELMLNTLSEHVDSNAECLKRLMIIVRDALPHTSRDVEGLMADWVQVNTEINNELKADIKKHDSVAG